MTQPSGACAICGKSTTQRCSRCTDGVDKGGSPPPTYYCSKECQAANFQDHKAVCRNSNARKQLYRAGAILQEVYYFFREATFDELIYNARVDGGTLHITVPEYSKDRGMVLYPLSEDQIADTMLKKSMLTWHNCEQAWLYMEDLTRKLLEGIKPIPTFKEKRVRIKPDLIKIVPYFESGDSGPSNPLHKVLSLTLDDGNEYIMDLAGAQHGQFEAVMPMDQYDRLVDHINAQDFMERLASGTSVEEICEDPHLKNAFMNPEGRAALERLSKMSNFCLNSGGGGDPKVKPLHRPVVHWMKMAIQAWEVRKKKLVGHLLSGKEAAYEMKKGDFISMLKYEILCGTTDLVTYGVRVHKKK